MPKSRGNGLLWLVLLLALGVLLGSQAGSWLVVDQPQPADVIVVLAGETEQRPAKGLEMLARGLAPRMVLDAPAGTHLYRWSRLELAQQYVNGLPEAARLSTCPIVGLSTRDEARDAGRCLAALGGTLPGGGAYGVHRVLLVTSDYHTRRALAIFRRELPSIEFSAAAAYDPGQYGVKWWQHRQWAKTAFDEWVRVVWWYGVDCWRG
jgi:uncharacterized SAM-binding protein YcdF (DUF218 family)